MRRSAVNGCCIPSYVWPCVCTRVFLLLPHAWLWHTIHNIHRWYLSHTRNHHHHHDQHRTENFTNTCINRNVISIVLVIYYLTERNGLITHTHTDAHTGAHPNHTKDSIFLQVYLIHSCTITVSRTGFLFWIEPELKNAWISYEKKLANGHQSIATTLFIINCSYITKLRADTDVHNYFFKYYFTFDHPHCDCGIFKLIISRGFIFKWLERWVFYF